MPADTKQKKVADVIRLNIHKPAPPAKAPRRWSWLYLLVIPGVMIGFMAGQMMALFGGIFSEVMFEIPDGAIQVPRLLFRPFGIVGMVLGALAAFALIRDIRR